jgi:hypothetical protein
MIIYGLINARLYPENNKSRNLITGHYFFLIVMNISNISRIPAKFFKEQGI